MSEVTIEKRNSGTLTLQVWSEEPFVFEADRLRILRDAIDHVTGGGVFFLNLSQKPRKPSRKAYLKPCLKIIAGKGGQVYSLNSKELSGLAAALAKAEAGEQSKFGFGYRILGTCEPPSQTEVRQ